MPKVVDKRKSLSKKKLSTLAAVNAPEWAFGDKRLTRQQHRLNLESIKRLDDDVESKEPIDDGLSSLSSLSSVTSVDLATVKTVHQNFGWWKSKTLGVAQHLTKGRLLFTTKFIAAGTHIMTEKPVYCASTHNKIAKLMLGDDRFRHIHPVLSDDVGDHDEIFDKKHTIKVVDLNCWGARDENGKSCTAVYLHMSMPNHSCTPNTSFSRNSLYAIKDILPGEELTVSYVSTNKLENLSGEARSRKMTTWFEECQCPSCVNNIYYTSKQIQDLHEWHPKQGVEKEYWQDENVEFFI
jgi:hypothetical protein